METPVLNTKQQKKALSGRKQKKETIKNVLANPYKSYWPEISAEENELLQAKVYPLLPQIKTEITKVPWSVVKNIPREKRRSFRKEYSGVDTDKDERKNLVFGINEVAKGLETQSLAAVLIAQDINPRKMVQHILDMSVLFKIPSLVVTDLRTLLKQYCGLSSSVIGFLREDSFKTILEIIRQISDKYPPPKEHTNFHRSLNSGGNDVSCIEIESSDEDVHIIDNEESANETTLYNKFYLKRASASSRSFVPEREHLCDTNGADLSFLPFGEKLIASTPTVEYRSLMVKRFKANPERNGQKPYSKS